VAVAVDQQILVAGTSAVPLSYTVPNSIEAALLCVNATIDGTAAPSSFLATVEIVSDGGVVVARCPCFTTVPAGGQAEISWFRLRDTNIDTTPSNTPYEELILTTGGLVLYWKLDDPAASTTTADKLGVNPGNVYDSIAFAQPALADGTSALYGLGMTGTKTDVVVDQSTQLMSMVVWVKTTAVAAQNTIAWADTSSPNGRWFTVVMAPGGNIFVTIYNTAAGAVGFNGAIPVNDGNKHCVAFTYGATTPSTGVGAVGSVYIDGVLDTATPLAMGGNGLAFANHSVVLGAKWRNAFDGTSGINKFVGTLDEFALFNSTLTAAEVAAINTAGRVF
jgi:hypothetical protein